MNRCVRVCVGVCFCLWLALAFFFSICNFHSCPSHLNFARLKGRQANLLRIYRLCKLLKFSNENFNYYAAFEGKLCSNNTATAATAGECFKCIFFKCSSKKIQRCGDRDECAACCLLPAPTSAYAANYAHITHTPCCQFPYVLHVLGAWLRVIFTRGLWHVVLCTAGDAYDLPCLTRLCSSFIVDWHSAASCCLCIPCEVIGE